ncbi:hypothetical protein OAD54_01395 [Candidatus Pelagibacter sp.]|nr:hypothetical protein [Candidatus Pelagibacter sp.]
MKYYTQEELTEAINIAAQVINDRTESCTEFTYGTNCCASLLIAYDKALRGSSSNAELDFQWSGVKDFVVKLKRHGFTVEEYLEYCGYEIIKNKRPLLGDVAFAGGSMIAGPRGWISTSDKNEGIVRCKQIMFLELNIDTIARPKRNNK